MKGNKYFKNALDSFKKALNKDLTEENKAIGLLAGVGQLLLIKSPKGGT